MGTSEKSGILAIVDLDNVLSSLKDVPPERCPEWLMQRLKEVGDVVLAFALSDFRIHQPALDRALMLNGFFPVQCPKTVVHATGGKKDSVDGVTIELVHSVLLAAPGITTIVLASGDRDFVPMLATWKRKGKQILVLAGSRLSTELSEVAHQVVPLGRPVAPLEQFITAVRQARSVDDLLQIKDPGVILVRNQLAAYFRDLNIRHTRSTRFEGSTKQFMIKGIMNISALGLSQQEALLLVHGLIGRVLSTHRSDGGVVYHMLIESSPFGQFITGQVNAA